MIWGLEFGKQVDALTLAACVLGIVLWAGVERESWLKEQNKKA